MGTLFKIFKVVFAISLLLCGFAQAANAKWPDPKESLKKWAAQKDPRREADSVDGPIQRRIKILTDGTSSNPESPFIVDSPDPSMILPIRYPNNETRFRINFTGMFYIEAENPETFFRGGIFTIQHSRGFYEDGTEMELLYDGSASPWDVVIYENDDGEQIAFGGVMPQPEKGKLPDLSMNATRSRWWGTVSHRKLKSGGYEEKIYWQAPLHDFNRQDREEVWEGHGYGGILLTKFDEAQGFHVPEKMPNGNFLMFYERVAEEKEAPDRGVLPWITTLFSRELTPDLKSSTGPEHLTSSVISPITNDYFDAVCRGDRAENGFLIEGASILFEKDRGQWIKSFSANEFTGRYGIYLDYLPPGADPRELFNPVMDRKGELIDFASVLHLREILKATWVGRPVLEYAPDGKLWLRFHFVPTDLLPKGAPHEGLPPYELWGSYPRFIAQVPVKIEYSREGVPTLAWDLDDEFSWQNEF
jgi:hypothetical protein